jgi:hypothetical protein
VAKYDRLFEYLCRAGDGPLDLTFASIDTLVGGLPASARRHRTWWANEASGRHVQAHAWINAGREVVAVDLGSGTVSFSAARWTRGS